jgi:DNA-binding ferritin-like protein
MHNFFALITDKIEKTAEVAIEVIDTVAEATEKVAGEVADAFPGNENLKEAASRIKTVTDAIEEDAEKAEALIEKVSLVTQSYFLSEEKTQAIAPRQY